jgi:hypothetical protein
MAIAPGSTLTQAAMRRAPLQPSTYVVRDQRRDDRDRHADHAETVAALRRCRRRQPAQRENEADTPEIK